MMSGASSRWETRDRYDETAERYAHLWEEMPPWDSVDRRMVELGLS